MKHITFADKSLFVGDEAADVMLEYAAALASHQTADTVKLKAIGTDGAEVVATFLLDAGAPLMAETSPSVVDEPDNADAIEKMRERMIRLSSPPTAMPEDSTMPANYEDLNL